MPLPSALGARHSLHFRSELIGLSRPPHKYHFRASNSRASPAPSSTYIPRPRRSNNYYMTNNLTRYQVRGIIVCEFRFPAPPTFPVWNLPPPCATLSSAQPLCSPRRCVILFLLLPSVLFKRRKLACPPPRRL